MRACRLLPTKLIVGGRGAVLPAEVLARNGLFDEECLPHYGADHDFYLRARKRGIALYTVTEAIVDVDATRSSAASHPGRLTLREFVETLSSVRSHRNIPHMVELFRRHYPVRHLHMIGVALCAARYCVVYAWARLRLALWPGSSSPRPASPR
jgi:GT2 family glycosyltransferase